jgi:hypothetical protein
MGPSRRGEALAGNALGVGGNVGAGERGRGHAKRESDRLGRVRGSDWDCSHRTGNAKRGSDRLDTSRLAGGVRGVVDLLGGNWRFTLGETGR